MVRERAIDRERIGAKLGVEPSRDHDLIGIAGRDELLHSADPIHEGRLWSMVEVNPSSPRATRGSNRGQGERGGGPGRPSQVAQEHADLHHGRVVGPVEGGGIGLADMGVLAITSSRWRRLSKTSRLSVNMNTASGSFWSSLAGPGDARRGGSCRRTGIPPPRPGIEQARHRDRLVN